MFVGRSFHIPGQSWSPGQLEWRKQKFPAIKTDFQLCKIIVIDHFKWKWPNGFKNSRDKSAELFWLLCLQKIVLFVFAHFVEENNYLKLA